MTKLTGQKKIDFLNRLNKGRRKAGLKLLKVTNTKSKTKSKPKTKKKSVKSRAPVKVKKTKRTTKSMPKKTKRSSSRRGFKVPFLSSPTVKKVAAGVGMGTVITTILGAVGQGQLAQNPAVKVLGGFIGGDLVGAASALFLGGGLNILNGGGAQQGAQGGI